MCVYIYNKNLTAQRSVLSTAFDSCKYLAAQVDDTKLAKSLRDMNKVVVRRKGKLYKINQKATQDEIKNKSNCTGVPALLLQFLLFNETKTKTIRKKAVFTQTLPF